MNSSKTEILPSPLVLKRTCKALALLDAAFMPDWEMRYFSFDSRWDEKKGIEMASARDGEGAQWYFIFRDDEAVGKYYSDNGSEARVSDSSSKSDLLNYLMQEPAFHFDRLDFLASWSHQEKKWNISGDPHHPQLLQFLVQGPAYYQHWATEYYNEPVSEKEVKEVFETNSVNGLSCIQDEELFKGEAYSILGP